MCQAQEDRAQAKNEALVAETSELDQSQAERLEYHRQVRLADAYQKQCITQGLLVGLEALPEADKASKEVHGKGT